MENTGDLIELTVRPNEMQAGLVRAALESAGIESYTAVAGGVMSNAEFGNVFVPTAVLVSPVDAARAREALDRTREDSVDIDWSEVNTGDDSPLTDRERGVGTEAGSRDRSLRWYVCAFVVLSLALFLAML